MTNDLFEGYIYPLSVDEIRDIILPALELRSELSRKGKDKYVGMLKQCTDDSRVKNSFTYHGAHTGRFAARGINIQNMHRPQFTDVDACFAALDDHEFATMVWGTPTDIACSLTRSAIQAEPGNVLLVSDYSAIEARVLAWCAGMHDVLDVFRGDGKIYEHTAAGIYRKPIDDVTKDERFIGKVACLAEGTMVLTDRGEVPIEHVTIAMKVWDGVEWVNHDGPVFNGEKDTVSYDGITATRNHKVFIDFDKSIPLIECINKKLRPIQSVWDRAILYKKPLWKGEGRSRVWDIVNAGPRHRYTANGRLVSNCLALGYGGGVGAFTQMARAYGIKDLDADFAEEIKTKWREANPKAVAYWHGVETMAKSAISNPGKIYSFRNRYAINKGGRLLIRLPSGRRLSYWQPKIIDSEKFPGMEEITYFGTDSKTRKWARLSTYGGKLTENIVQAIARDILCYALVNLEKEGFPVVMHVHDEIVCEVTENRSGDLAAMESIMCQLPPWAEGLPLDAEGGVMRRYQKL